MWRLRGGHSSFQDFLNTFLLLIDLIEWIVREEACINSEEV